LRSQWYGIILSWFFIIIISFWWNLLQLVSTLYLILFYYWWSKDLFLFYRKSHASKKHLILVISKIESEFKTTILTIYFLWIELGCSSKLILWIEQSTDKKSCCRKNVGGFVERMYQGSASSGLRLHRLFMKF